ncbi:hypothetical protein BH23PSE1_BH23PSE1_01560 [soil metagenome]
MPQDFVLFCEARTGSYSLVSRLDSCPGIVCHKEIFKRKRIELPGAHLDRLSIRSVEARNAAPRRFLAELRALDPGRIVGFKLFNTHLRWTPGLEAHLQAPATRRVVLWRDPLEVYASSLRAKATGIWTHRNDHDRHRDRPEAALAARVRYTPESLARFAARYNAFLAMANRLAALPGSFVIHYEQIGDAAALAALLGFLGSPADPAATSSDYAKQYTGSLAGGFENWEALAAAAGGGLFLPGPAPSHAPRAGP